MMSTFRQYPKALQARNKTGMPSFMICRSTKDNTYLAAGHACTEGVIADADFFIDDMIRKVVLSPSHRTDEHNDVMCFG